MIIELFCGAGGASEGIRQAIGKSPDLAFDFWKIACETHAKNHSGETICADIGKIGEKAIKEYTNGKPIKLLWASPPCTEFSIAKRHEKNKDIADLIYTPLIWAQNADIENLVIENVPDLNNYDHCKILIDRLSKRFKRVESYIIKHSHCGGATMRKRLFIIARNTDFVLNFEKQKAKSTRDYLTKKREWKPLITSDVYTLTAIKNHDPLNIINTDFICLRNLNPSIYSISGLTPTIATKGSNIWIINAQKTHYSHLTITELKLLQGFNRFFAFCGKRSHQMRQIGNSVPPQMAKTIIKALKLNKGVENEH
ncbi:MAG: DNA cytosine methyltransferase [Helicobacteraceae bacterium]|jgi:site-specific DNA-cytosine methylase|nr:DNA cytosine methyltransferase [Helicobacteraceae bacterium]